MAKNEDYNDIIKHHLKLFKEDTKYEKLFKDAMKKFNITSIKNLSDTTKKAFFNYIDKHYTSKNETSSSGTAGAFLTPNAFSKNKTVRRDLNPYEDDDSKVNEIINQDIPPKKSIAMAIKEVRSNLNNIEKRINNAIKLKEDNKLGTNNLYKRTHRHISKIGEQITRILNNLQRIK